MLLNRYTRLGFTATPMRRYGEDALVQPGVVSLSAVARPAAASVVVSAPTVSVATGIPGVGARPAVVKSVSPVSVAASVHAPAPVVTKQPSIISLTTATYAPAPVAMKRPLTVSLAASPYAPAPVCVVAPSTVALTVTVFTWRPAEVLALLARAVDVSCHCRADDRGRVRAVDDTTLARAARLN